MTIDGGPKMPRYANALTDAEADRVEQLIARERSAYDQEQRHHRANMQAVMRKRPTRLRIVDATPERLAMADSDHINPAEIDSSEQRIGRVRRLVADPLDRLFRHGAITRPQFDAGDWWRDAAQDAGLVHAGRQGYEPRSAGTPVYGHMPKTERAAFAREQLRRLGAVLSLDDRHILDRLCVQGEFTARGRSGQSYLVVARLALDRLAVALKRP